MRMFFIGLLFATILAASIVTLVDRVASAPAVPPVGDAAHLRRLEAKIASLESRLGEIANHLRPPSSEERPLPEGVTSRPIFDGSPTIGQHLSDLEGSLFDFEREIRRDLRHLYEALRRRLDRLESKGVPVRAPADAAAARPELVKRVAEDGVRYDPAAGRIRFEAVIASPTRALEFIAVAPGGNAHESLLVANVGAASLSLAIADMGLKEAQDADFEQDLPPRGDSLFMYVEWPGLPRPVRVETLVKDGRNGEMLPFSPFAYTASRTFLDTKTFEDHLAAAVYHHIVALSWKHNADCILACSSKETRDENRWIPDSKACPEPGTSVDVILSKTPVTEWETRK